MTHAAPPYDMAETNPVVQFVAHTFFYGTVLGAYLNWALSGALAGEHRR